MSPTGVEVPVAAAEVTTGLAAFAAMGAHFAALPPEINSGRLYSGPGTGPLMAAAGAWDQLAAELAVTASGYQSVISELTALQWVGPSSTAMVAALTPYMAWLNETAAQAEQTGMQARAAAAAYETAFAMTVPPPVIAANRVLLSTLIATNFFGQNTPAIAATEAQYAEFWAQDATAMYGYTAASATSSSALTPFSAPPKTTNPGGLAAQETAVGKAGALAAGTAGRTTTPTGLTGISSTLGDIWSKLSSLSFGSFTTGATQNLNIVVNTWGLSYFGSGVPQLSMFFSQQFLPEPPAEIAAGVLPAPELMRTGPGVGAATPSVSGSLARAGRVGLMSVPPSWTTPPSALTAGHGGTSGATLVSARTGPTDHMLVPATPMTGQRRAAQFAQRRYGIRHTVMPRPPGGG